ncbi:MAG: hypothetical protein K2J28_09720, partial [Duncaniella sp.]|nr:hypothetical protein [Duncaniella sp.]
PSPSRNSTSTSSPTSRKRHKPFLTNPRGFSEITKTTDSYLVSVRMPFLAEDRYESVVFGGIKGK